MADNRLQNAEPLEDAVHKGFKEAVCVNTNRIYDSCSDKDCLEDIRVFFTPRDQGAVDEAVSVRCRKADVLSVTLDVEPVPFNRGFYSIDLTFFFETVCDVYTCPSSHPCTVTGLAMFSKKVILFGSEGSVRIFSSDFSGGENDPQGKPSINLPKAVCQVADPIVLAAKICDTCECKCKNDCGAESACSIPEHICSRFGEDLVSCNRKAKKGIFVTLGLFTIVQIERDVQILIPVYDFCVPNKECVSTGENPCDLFKKIKFPLDQFFPPRIDELGRDEDKGHKCCR